MRVLFLNPEQYVSFENEPSNYQIRLPAINAGIISEYADFVYQRSYKNSGPKVMNEETLNVFNQFKPDIVINSLCWWDQCVDPKTLGVMRENGAKVISIYWDTWINALPHETEIFINSDHILVMDSLSNYLKYRLLSEHHKNINKVIFSPIAVFTDLIKPCKVNKDIDVLMLGSSEGQRSDLILYLKQNFKERTINFQHIGGLVDDSIPEQDNNTWVNWETYIQTINRSKICLCSQTMHDRIQIKGKVFDFLASQAFCLTDTNPELQKFLPDNCIAYFSDKNDCISKIDYYLENKKSRYEIAKNGHMWFKKNYDYKELWTNILNVAIGKENNIIQLPHIEEIYHDFSQQQNLIIRLQTSAINQLARLIGAGQNPVRLPVRAEGSYKGLNILNVDERYLIVCDQLDIDFTEINKDLFAISPDSGLILLNEEEIKVSPETRIIRVNNVERAKQAIDLISNKYDS